MWDACVPIAGPVSPEWGHSQVRTFMGTAPGRELLVAERGGKQAVFSYLSHHSLVGEAEDLFPSTVLLHCVIDVPLQH